MKSEVIFMKNEEIRAIVAETVNALLKNSMIKYSDLIIYERTSDKLREYYKDNKDILINRALESLVDHLYFDVLEMYYKDNWTLEEIAEYYDVDISTIVRNKKQLCLKIFNLIN